jgi:soluble lytic murein transglycosylase
MLAMRTFRFVFPTLVVLLGLLAASCNFPLINGSPQGPGQDDGAAASSTVSPTPMPTPTATPLPQVRLEEGDWALFNGDWDRALQSYQFALQTSASPEVAAAAQLGIGTTRLRAQRYAEALQALTVFVESYPTYPSLGQGYFLRAQANEGLGDLPAAIRDYDRYLELRPGLIDSYVHEKVGDALRALGNPSEALIRFQAAFEAPRTGTIHGLWIKIGHSYMESGDYAMAVQTFDEVYRMISDGATRASMNLLAGRALEAMGDVEGAHARYLDSVDNYPSAYSSYLGLIELVDAEVPVDELLRGLVDYYAEAYQPALNAFNRYLQEFPGANVYYYRGLTLRALGDLDGALLDFQFVIDNYPSDALVTNAWLEISNIYWPLQNDLNAALEALLAFVASRPADPEAAEALYDAGRLAERSGALASAADIWLRISNEYPESSYAYWGSWESGFVLYRMQDYGAARQSFQVANGFATDGAKVAATQLWIGKTYAAQGNQDLARTAWELAAAADPAGYYSIRAQDLLAGRDPFASFGVFDFSTDLEAERLQADAWMRLTFGIESPASLFELDAALLQDEHWIRGEEFWSLGLFSEARLEFGTLRTQVQSDPAATFRLVHKFLDLGLYPSAIIATFRILDLAGIEAEDFQSAPPYFAHILYGPYFGELILIEAFNNDLNGLFLYSVARWESGLFEVFATSYANARGLMQVIPSTGREIAGQLGWPPGYSDADLYRPIVSMRFGAYYLGQQVERFDGDLYAALAAYNAGPGNAAIWKEMAPEDYDLYLEVIRLNQPHLYIRRIYEAYVVYRALYSVP